MKKRLIILPLVATLLGGCVGTKHYSEDKYMDKCYWDMSKDFKILQLSDVHLSQSDVFEEHTAVIKRTIKAANPNLIVLNGDIFTFADKHVVNKFFEFIDAQGISWTYTFGNHDDQGYYSDTYIPELLSKDKISRFKNVKIQYLADDDVTGRTNFVINIVNKSDVKHVEYQVFVLDSHSYNFDTMRYDAMKQDQLDWYKRMINYSTKHKDFGGGVGSVVPSSMYMHIGIPEVMDPWDKNKDKEDQEGLIIGDMEEWDGSPETDPGFFKAIKELGSTKSIHVAHDHANDSVMKYKGTDIYVCFGVHATNRIYNDEKGVKFGGQVVRISKTDKSLSFKNYYVSYENTKVVETEGWQN